MSSHTVLPVNAATDVHHTKLQALVYNILPPTAAITDYATGLEKLQANEVFHWCSKGSRFATDNSSYIRRFFYNCCLHQHNNNKMKIV